MISLIVFNIFFSNIDIEIIYLSYPIHLFLVSKLDYFKLMFRKLLSNIFDLVKRRAAKIIFIQVLLK